MKWPWPIETGAASESWVCVWCDHWNELPERDGIEPCEQCGKLNSIEERRESAHSASYWSFPVATPTDVKYCEAMGREIPINVRRAA